AARLNLSGSLETRIPNNIHFTLPSSESSGTSGRKSNVGLHRKQYPRLSQRSSTYSVSTYLDWSQSGSDSDPGPRPLQYVPAHGGGDMTLGIVVIDYLVLPLMPLDHQAGDRLLDGV